MKNFPRLIGLSLMLLVGSPSAFSQSVSAISPKEATVLLESGKGVLVDVREKEELAEGMLAGAIWLPTSAVESGDGSALKTIAGMDKSKTIIVYCRSGRRAGRIGARLEAEGFDVRNLGGFADARDAGMKTTQPGTR